MTVLLIKLYLQKMLFCMCVCGGGCSVDVVFVLLLTLLLLSFTTEICAVNSSGHSHASDVNIVLASTI